MTIVRFDENKTLTLGTLKKRAYDALTDPNLRQVLGFMEIGTAKGTAPFGGYFATLKKDEIAEASCSVDHFTVTCDAARQVIVITCADGSYFFVVRSSEGFDLIPDPEIAQREQARPVIVGAKLPSETLEEAHQRVDLKEYAIQDQAAREALDDEDAQYRHDAMLEDRDSVSIHPANSGAVEKERIRTDGEKLKEMIHSDDEEFRSRSAYEERIEKAVTRTTPGPKRGLDGRIQQMLGVRSQMVGKKKKLAVTNGGDPNCKRCAADLVPCKAHGGARKRKAARELQAIFC